MEAKPKKQKQSSIQTVETVEMIHDDSNLNGKGSNALILPGKKRRKTEGKEKVSRRNKTTVSPAISKSKQRKLQKLQEEKEKKLMLCKSIRMLQKYKISDEAYSILQSSGTIGQAETLREKRRLAIHFSKAGLEVPDDISLFNKKEKKISENVKILEKDVENVSPTAGPMMVADDSKQHSLQNRLDITMKNSMSVDDESDMLSDINGATKVSGGFVDGVKSFIPSSLTTDSQSDARIQEQELSGANICARKHEAPKPRATVGHVNSSIVVHVSRPLEVEAQRKHLPIIMMEQEIMEAINEHSILILCGETGCGKTTQVPQFLYEAGYGSSNHNNRNGIIGITQPRRVAVLATAKRVSYELGFQLGREVGFQVRHDKMIGNACSIKFMTDGILLREVQSDFLLKRYSVIILDEAHERSLNTDILIGMLSRIIKVRQELCDEQHKKIVSGAKISPENLVTRLKVMLMSATLRVEDFVSNKRLFQVAPPVLEVPVRQFPVTIHFSRKTTEDYVNNAYKKVLSIHKRLPHGGILVFLTGQREVEYLCKKLRKASQELSENSMKKKKMDDESSSALGLDLKDIDEAFGIDDSFSEDQTEFEEIDNRFSESETDSESAEESEDESSVKIDGTVLNFLQNPENLSSLKTAFENLTGNNPKKTEEEEPDLQPAHLQPAAPVKESPFAPLYVLPLYAMLPAAAQLRVFEKVPDGERLVVVATNVAETSLTIPGIRYVVDTGKEKVKNYNHGDGMASFEVQWISKASAAQRAGRAGRTGPGHCYRLYSAAAFGKDDIFNEFSCPEILKIPVDGVVLMMKFTGIDKVENFPFPTPPKISALEEAERCLKAIDALDKNGKLTSLGRSMAQFPMSPRHSRMILTVIHILAKNSIFSRPNLLLAYAAASAAALSFPNPFLMQLDNHGDGDHKALDHEEKLRKKKLKSMAKASRARFHNPTSDSLTIAYALQSFDLAENTFDFCRSNSLHFKTMEEMSKLRKQILQLIFHHQKAHREDSWRHGDFNDVQRAWLVPSSKHPLQINEEEILSQAICAGWADRVAKRVRMITGSSDKEHRVHSMRYQSSAMDEAVFLHRRSSVSQTAPEFVVYAELLCTNRPYMHGLTAIKSDWLVRYANSACIFSAPLVDPKPYYEPLSDCVFCWVNPTFGRHNWQLPLHSLPIEDEDFRVAVFASALLEGNVLPCLKTWKNFLSATPSSLLRQEALGQRRVSDLLSRLRMGSVIVDSRAKLKEVWSENSVFLRLEIQNWFQKRFHGQFERLWEQMLEEAKLEGAELFPKRAKRERKVGR
ncbi:ATP-dependent RNA helicase DEAH13 [Phalaenopsis equestris]|uniref:ATP-dependent RNA helicase DEAH13 n=1 Tax=Phalaenopsis equestris TaxID=78828 RepID=UPI0009E50260|nr:ATP-dependent RNA helicase DEAH13 [Phalaenopsis equestris]XP_020591883.1 ATP-dependent RNA helicase DEAH13 [Phalaenopsis equestris]